MLILFLILAPMFIAAAVSYAFFWYEAANDPSCRSHLERVAQGRVMPLLLKGALWSIFSQILSLLLLPLHFRTSLWNPAPDPASSRPTILLVHGLYHNPSGWFLFRRRLKRAGYANVYAWKCALWKYSLDDLLEQLDRWVAEVTGPLPGKPVVLIGHSLGGLLVRAYAKKSAAGRKVAGVITLGTPHQGTKIAVFGLGRGCKCIRYRDPIIEALEREPSEDDIVRVAVYSPIDNMVFPSEALKVAEPHWIHQESPPTSHLAMLYHRPTTDMVLRILRDISLGSME